jgi:quercetin dioxygenase-like cupin family protein
MNNEKYVKLVNEGKFPDNIKVPLDTPFQDTRGIIQNLWLGGCGSITYITTVKGSERANHTHIDDWHTIFVIEGSLLYIEGEGDKRTETEFGAGALFFTKPEIYHKLIFTSDTKMITINGIVKNHENYEASIIRNIK